MVQYLKDNPICQVCDKNKATNVAYYGSTPELSYCISCCKLRFGVVPKEKPRVGLSEEV